MPFRDTTLDPDIPPPSRTGTYPMGWDIVGGFNTASNSIVGVESGKIDSSINGGIAAHGSGFFVKRHHENTCEIFTDLHVIEYLSKDPQGNALSQIPEIHVVMKDGSMISAQIEKADPEDDLALLKPYPTIQDPRNNCPGLEIEDPKKPPSQYEQVLGLSSVLYHKTHSISPILGQVFGMFHFNEFSRIENYGPGERGSRWVLGFQSGFRHGDSGSPILNKQLKVISISQDTLPNTAYSLGAPAYYMQKLLDETESQHQ
jgi:hypothetical protein